MLAAVMQNTHPIWTAAIAVILINLPFGFWRAGLKRFTLPWFVAVHAPVPLIILLRFVAGLGWQFATLPLLVGAFVAGQFFGGKFRSWLEGRS